jgi:hypothetical protein
VARISPFDGMIHTPGGKNLRKGVLHASFSLV